MNLEAQMRGSAELEDRLQGESAGWVLPDCQGLGEGPHRAGTSASEEGWPLTSSEDAGLAGHQLVLPVEGPRLGNSNRDRKQTGKNKIFAPFSRLSVFL